MKRQIQIAFSAMVLATMTLYGATTSVSTNGLCLIDLTDDVGNRASVTASGDNLKNNPLTAFDNDQYRPDGGKRFGGNTGTLSSIYEFVVPQVVNGYRIWNQSASGGYDMVARAPKNFTLEARKTDKDEWTVIDTRTNETGWVAGEPRYYNFTNYTAFKFYKLTITANNGNAYTVIQELEYFFINTDAREFRIVSVPDECGMVYPSYGIWATNKGETVTFSAPTTWTNLEANIVAECLGYNVYTQENGGTVWTQSFHGTNTTFNYVQPDGSLKVEWLFDVDVRVDVVVTGQGSATGSGWYQVGTPVSLTATPGENDTFFKWTFDGISYDETKENPLTVIASSPFTATALFTGLRYVSSVGSDDNNGMTPDTPFLTISNAVEQLSGGGTIRVAPGWYPIKDPISLTNAIAIYGETGNPEDVVVTNASGYYATTIKPVFRVENKDALLANMVIAGGRYSGSDGGNVNISEKGGCVSNCVMRNGESRQGYWGGGTGLSMKGGVVTHCVISNNLLLASPTGPGQGVAGVYVLNGRLENSLVAFNNEWASSGDGYAGVRVDGTGCVVNCTIVTNITCATGARLCGGVYISSAKACVTNCVMAENYIQITNETGAVMLKSPWNAAGSVATNNFVNCAGDDLISINETCFVGKSATFFRNYETGDFRPSQHGLLIDNGINYSDMDEFDLLFNPRLVGKYIDIGCYEGLYCSTRILIR